jgi:DNA-directed RNA polymerase alpha subunit
MTKAQITHAFPDLSEGQALLALLSETLEMARSMKLAQIEMNAVKANAQQMESLISSAGLPDEISAAEKAAHTTIVEILARITEQDLEAGRNKGILSPDDYQEALTAKRTLSLARGRTDERDHEHEA